jgi:hypothetical protein
MEKKGGLTKTLAVAGTMLVWFPVLAPVMLGIISLFTDGVFHLDYLMPAELLPCVLLGSGMLLWAALRVRIHHKLIGWSMIIAAAAFLLSTQLAEVSGLASGRIEAEGGWYILVLGLLIIYDLMVVLIGFGGLLLLKDLSNKA